MLNARRRDRHPAAPLASEGRIFHIQWCEQPAVAKVILHRAPVAVGLDPELAVALVPPAAEARPVLPFGQRVAGVQVPHPASGDLPLRQEAIAVNIDMVER